MKKNIVIPILLMSVIAIIFSSCQKELSCEGPACRGIYDDGKAVYTFVDSSGYCARPFVTGTYRKDVDLVFDNAVVIKADVSKTGTYTVTTDTVNGIYFKAFGTFTSTGIQTIILYGNGRPSADGDYTFITGSVSGCSFKVSVEPPLYLENYFYDITVDGKKHLLSVTTGGFLGNYSSSGPDVNLRGIIHNGQVQQHPDNRSSQVGLHVMKAAININDISIPGFQNFFTPGSYTYRILPALAGVIIYWADLNDGPWYWASYLGNQQGSNFTIISVESYTDRQGRPIAKVKAEFNCILYNEIGQSRTLTNGKFYGEFANILR